MTTLTVILLVLGLLVMIPVLIALALVVTLATRATILYTRPGSFPAYLLVDDKWVRGIAEYGRSRLIWRSAFRVSMRPEIELARRRIDVTDSPEQWYQSKLAVVKLNSDQTEVCFALRSGDAAGLISWIDSSPPGE